MHYGTIHVQPKGFSPIGFAQAAGLPGDIRIDFKTQSNLPYTAINSAFPQLVMRPFHYHETFAYDIVMDDPADASGLVSLPGSIMKDQFNIEVYTRNSDGNPLRMLAAGRVDLTAYSYMSGEKLSPDTWQVGPQGPPGPKGDQGPPGVRGSRWYTGVGAPVGVPGARIEGDMWLDEGNGDVWRWDDATRSWTAFKGK
jgi:hypothetical protein